MRLAVGPGARARDGAALAFLHGFPEMALRVGGAALDDRARHVAEVAGLRVAREDVDDDEFPRAQRPAAAFVRVARLLAAGDDGVRRRAARAEDGGVDLGAQALAGQHAAAPVEFRRRAPFAGSWRRRALPCRAPCRLR